MEEFVRNLNNPWWWVSAFVVAILANWAGDLLKVTADRYLLGAAGRRWRARSATRQAELERNAQLLSESPELVSKWRWHETRARMISIQFTLAAIACGVSHPMIRALGDSFVLHLVLAFLIGSAVGTLYGAMLFSKLANQRMTELYRGDEIRRERFAERRRLDEQAEK